MTKKQEIKQDVAEPVVKQEEIEELTQPIVEKVVLKKPEPSLLDNATVEEIGGLGVLIEKGNSLVYIPNAKIIKGQILPM